ncbi:precorrin-4 C(11)-methyltransferase [Pseudonocardia endophytica]|uniref:Precorrin-4 C11-methyltransferase n=1 Tax=Pseudonocardia endophytica TaxID=401976 RepID=A0A4R1HNR7_PSEEN|nr:precorrin-4 C(11)-methyltransferase [Pseudonocardia endophytica]TCK21339.1 precorrin-4 C11-methyltransferase [Pseudonocardia endophytica]
MTVHFVGAGPGAADLLTIRGRELLAASPVCLYAGSLVPTAMLDACRAGTRLVDTALMSLDEIVGEMLAADEEGLDVVRLVSGDPSVFSAIAEQIRRLDAAGVPFDVCPGVPAYAAAAAALGREFTVPTVAQTVTLTRVAAQATPMPADEGLGSLTAAAGTVVVHLAVHRIDEVVADLTAVHGGCCPVAVVAHASREHEIVLRGRLDSIAGAVREAGILRTAVIVAGPALAAEQFPGSHLYSDTRVRLPG